MAVTTISFAVRGPIRRTDLPGLTRRICALFTAAAPDLARCDVTGVRADVVAVEALAGLQLLAGQHRCRVLLHGCSADLRQLVALLGLADVLPEEPGGPAPVRRAEAADRTAGRADRSTGRR